MTLTISHNEIIVACLKAFEALGMAQGQREDAAEAIKRLKKFIDKKR